MKAMAEEQSTAVRMNPMAKVLLAQLGLSVVLAMLFWGFKGHVSGYSALLGGLTCVIPNAFLHCDLRCRAVTPGQVPW